MPPIEIRPPARALPDPVILRAPPAKSEALRALFVAALAGGGSVAGTGAWALDVRVFVRGLRALGVRIDESGGGLEVRSGPDLRSGEAVRIDAEDGGAPARFLQALAATLRRPVNVVGGARLSERPMAPLVSALAALGAEVSGGPGLPVTVRGPARGGEVRVDAGASSQFLSALLLAGPAFPRGVRIQVSGALVSRPYVDLTRRVMAASGVAVGPDLAVAPGASYRPAAFTVAPDWSGASVLLSAAAFLGRSVLVPGLDPGSPQPDARVADVLRALGMTVEACASGVRAAGPPIRGGTFDVGAFPDATPALAALATLAPEAVRFNGAAHLRLKESDRIDGLVTLLGAAGAAAEALPDGLIVRGGFRPEAEATPVAVETRHDHRLAMAAALLGLARPLVIDDAACVAKSFPGFFEQWPGRICEGDPT